MGQKTFTQFRRDNIVTTLPTTLEYGKEVYYKDASGNLTLWVGHEDGSAWPAVGYKEWNGLVLIGESSSTVAHVVSDFEDGDVVLTTTDFEVSINKFSKVVYISLEDAESVTDGANPWISSSSSLSITTFGIRDYIGGANMAGSVNVSIRVYP
jgi:hypothetical protein